MARKLSFISCWHFMEAVHKYQPINLKEISNLFGVTTVEAYQVLNRLGSRGLIKQQSRKVKRYVLTKRADKLLKKQSREFVNTPERYKAYSFLHGSQTNNSRERARRKGKKFIEAIP